MRPFADLVASWVLGDLPPEEVPPLAVEALGGGCSADEVAALSGLRTPTRADVEEELPRLLRRMGIERPTGRVALKHLVDGCAQRIVDGSIPAAEGAHEIWQYVHFRTAGTGARFDVAHELEGFTDAAGSWTQYEADIVQAARTLLAGGGLRVD